MVAVAARLTTYLSWVAGNNADTIGSKSAPHEMVSDTAPVFDQTFTLAPATTVTFALSLYSLNAGFLVGVLETDRYVVVTRTGATMTERAVCERGLSRFSSKLTDGSTIQNMTSLAIKNLSTTETAAVRVVILPGTPIL